MKHKQTTCTCVVFDLLKQADDFLTEKEVKELTKLNCNQVSASLISLRNYKAIACLSQEGQLYWYATPENDTRICVVEERTPESKPRKPRRKKAKQ